MSKGRKTLRSVRLYMLLAFLIYGGWAFYVNWSAGAAQATLSGVVQGAYSGLNTYIYARIIELCFDRIADRRMRWIIPALLPNLLFLSMLSLIHWVAETPAMLMTMLPSAVIGTAYTALYTTQLHRAEAS